MVSDLDIYRTAKLLLDNRADGSEAEAERCEPAMVQRGDLVGVIVWQRVMSALKQLRQTVPAIGSELH